MKKNKNKSVDLLLAQREQLQKNFGEQIHYTPPNPSHYPHLYLWDSCFGAIIYGRSDRPDLAQEEIEEILKGQDPKTGFIPNMRFMQKGRKFDPERYLFSRSWYGSDYTQPPILALAVWETYEAYVRLKNRKKGLAFLKSTYQQIVLFYDYFLHHRFDKKKHLIYIIHPHETGRDSDPIFDQFKLRLKRNGVRTSFVINTINSVLDYTSALFLTWNIAHAKGSTKEVLKRFQVYDVMMNCMYVDNVEILSDIATVVKHPRDIKHFQQLAREVEKAVVSTMKFGTVYYSLNQQAQPIKQLSISSLFPLILSHAKLVDIQDLMALIENKEYFNTEYPFPSVPVKDRNFDPHYQEKGRLWRGPTWINTNWYLVERGLKRQADRLVKKDSKLSKVLQKTAQHVIKKTSEMVENEGFWEFYDPMTGKGYRVGGKEIGNMFTWSILNMIL